MESVLVPQPEMPAQVTSMEYRRIVFAIAIPALVLFLPSLVLAGVPVALWLPFTMIAFLGAAFVTTSFLSVSYGSRLSLLTPLIDGIVIAGLGLTFRPYYHVLDLLYGLVVAGHAIVHGIGAGLIAAAVGTFVVVLALHDPALANGSDVLYASLYLAGMALFPWTARRLAERRAGLIRRSRREIAAQRTRLEAVLRGINDAVIVVQRSGDIVLANSAYDRISSSLQQLTAPRDVRGRRLAEGHGPLARAARGESFEMSFTIDSPDGERRWYEAHGAPVGAAHDLDGGVVVIRDITDRSLRIQEEEFIATASHELRTPLAALHGYVQLLERRLDPSTQPRESEYARVALSQARRTGVLLERLFDLTRLQSGQLEITIEPVDLIEVVRRAVSASKQLVTTQEIVFDIPKQSIVVEADAGRFEQVLLNVLTNAIEHAPEAKRIEVAIGRADGRALVTVHDDGPGMPPQQLARLNGVDSKDGEASGINHGLGLGLSISRELMQAQRGTIDVSSAPGAGTTVTLQLPLTSESRRAGGSGRR